MEIFLAKFLRDFQKNGVRHDIEKFAKSARMPILRVEAKIGVSWIMPARIIEIKKYYIYSNDLPSLNNVA